ncbi:DUF2142 domain-containing protein [Atopobiaceae bacterium 24-176]
MAETARHRPPAGVVVALLLAAGATLWLVCAGLLGMGWRQALLPAALAPSAALVAIEAKRLAARPWAAILAVLVPVGLVLCAYMPAIVSVSWDGYVHYRAANNIAQGEVTVSTLADNVLYDMDGIYDVGLFPLGTSDDDWHPNWNSILSDEGTAHANERFKELDKVIANRTTNPSHPGATTAGRLPNALGLAVGDAVGAPFLVRLFLGRAANLLCYAAIMALAASWLKRGGWTVFAIAVTPTLVFMACNYSYDPFAISLVTLAACRFVGELQRPDERLTAGRAAWILVPFFVGTLTKAVFVPSALMLLFMPRSKFGSARSHRAWIEAGCLVVAALLASFAVPFLLSGGNAVADARGGATDIDSQRQLAHILGHPLSYAVTLICSFLWVFNPASAFCLLPVSLCYLPMPDGWQAMAAVWVCLALGCATLDRGPVDDRWRSPALGWGTFAGIALSFVLMATALYLGYTNVGAFLVSGLQVRYLLFEIAPFLLLCLNFGTGPRRFLFGKLEKAGGAALALRVEKGLPRAALWAGLCLLWAVAVLGFAVRF